MGNLLKEMLRNRSARVLLLLFLSFLFLIAYFIVHSYYVQLDIHKRKVLSRLDAIAKTASIQLDASQLDYLLKEYSEKDAIKSNQEVRVYELLNEKLAEIKEQNQLKTDIYTLSYDPTNNRFFFGVSSSQKPYFRHVFKEFPEVLKENYEKGGQIGVYEDENGSWLSAFYPIYNSEGKTIAVVQADQLFDEFLEEVRREIGYNIIISISVILLLSFFLIRTIKQILDKEDKMTEHLRRTKVVLEQKNNDILDSLNYAQKIQDAILPQKNEFNALFSEAFAMHIPRDIVSGDFFWLNQSTDKLFVACADCTGHGVPGAFMSMIGAVLLDDIVEKRKIIEPDEILNQLHLMIVKVLKQHQEDSASKDGMDIALCVIDKKNLSLNFAGAFRPLIHVRKGELQRIKSDPKPIGGYRRDSDGFQSHSIQLEKGDMIYLYSDGFADQFGGEKNKKYLTKKFRRFLCSISNQDVMSQEEALKKEFYQWKQEMDQVDDVLVVGFRI